MSDDQDPASVHLDNALAAYAAGNQLDLAISEYEHALSLGLSEDKEIAARYFLGTAYSRKAAQEVMPTEQMVKILEWRRAEEELERALTLDRTSGLGYFSTRVGRALLARLDSVYKITGSALGKENSRAAITYLEGRVQICDYLSSPPLLKSLLELGAYYCDIGDSQRAIACWQKLLAAEPVNMENAEDERETRAHAARNIQEVQATPGKVSSGCLLAVAMCCFMVIGIGIILRLLS